MMDYWVVFRLGQGEVNVDVGSEVVLFQIMHLGLIGTAVYAALVLLGVLKANHTPEQLDQLKSVLFLSLPFVVLPLLLKLADMYPDLASVFQGIIVVSMLAGLYASYVLLRKERETLSKEP